jgi:hypothetical protein
MKRLILGATIAALVLGCGGGSGPTPSPGGTQAGTPVGTTAGGAATSVPGGQAPQYVAGAGTATVLVDSVSYPITGGTCALASSDAGSGVTASKFSFVAGTAFKAGWLDIELTDLSSPIHDGEYRTGLSTVAVQVTDKDLLVGGLTITLQNGLTAGSFSGTSAGNNPGPVSGTFTC